MRHRHLSIAAAVLAAGLSTACTADDGVPTVEVNRDDYGTAWPLTVDHAVLACEAGDVATLTVDGNSFRIDDVSDPRDAAPGRGRSPEPSRDRPSRGDTYLTPLVEAALDLYG